MNRFSSPFRDATRCRRALIGVACLLAALGALWLRFGAHSKSTVPGGELPALPDAARMDEALQAAVNQAAGELRNQPHDPGAWGKLGMILLAHRFPQEAKQCFDTASQFNPRDARWFYYLGSIARSEHPDVALAHWEISQRLEGDGGETSALSRAALLLEQGRLDAAAAALQLLLRRQPNHPQARLEMARIDFGRGAMDRAAAHLNACLSDFRTAKPALELQAALLAHTGRSSAESLERSRPLPLGPAWPNPYLAALDALRTNRRAWVEQAQRLLANGRLEDAKAPIDDLLRLYPNASEGWLYLGRWHYLRQEWNDAESAWRRHLDLEPDSVDGRLQMGQLRMRQGRWTEADAELQRVLELKPDAATAHYYLGLIHAEAGRLDEAVGRFENALNAEPQRVDVRLALARALDALDRPEDALRHLELALQVAPYDLSVQEALERRRAPRP